MTADEFVARYPIRQPDGPHGCWEWAGGTSGRAGGLRYGRIKWAGRSEYAHRAAYMVVIGPLKSRQQLVRNVSLCMGTELCCNPRHWLPVDLGAKPRLLARQGRLSSGAAHVVAVTLGMRRAGRKLDIHKAREIRASEAPSMELAQRYGVDVSMINLIRRNKAWREASPFSGLR